MKKAFEVWGWSVRILARSRLSVVVFAVFLGLWALAAYEWLWIPESSVLLLVLSVVWAIVQVAVVAAALAGTCTSALQAADANAGGLSWGFIGRRRFAQGLLWLISASAIGLALAKIFGWFNPHALEAASFLTFHSERPISYLLIGDFLAVLEGLVWIAVASSLLSFLTVLMRGGGRQVGQQFGKVLKQSCFGLPFVTAFLTVVVFGGFAYLLANWRPLVPAGFWDYLQLTVRIGLALILLSAGWFFWLLGLARQ